MKRTTPENLECYDMEVVEMMVEKYNLSPMDALRQFTQSKTHALLEDADCGLISFGFGALLDIWEAEKITGDPRNSVYLREE
jgi:hypothetical protein